jgi:hypothetical protein
MTTPPDPGWQTTLPAFETCVSCAFFRHCCGPLFYTTASSTVCHFTPNRFQPIPARTKLDGRPRCDRMVNAV